MESEEETGPKGVTVEPTNPERAVPDSDRFLLRWAGWSLAKRALFLGTISGVALVLFYSALVVARSVEFYRYLKSSERGWTDAVFTSDSQLGYVAVHGGRGRELMPERETVPASFDADGFRIAEGPVPKTPSERAILALGCSWTYGAACPAEDTFAYRVSGRLHRTALNAALPSYGLSQMLLLARTLIPAHRPDYVLVQCSDWLVRRSQTGLADTEYGYVPTPFFFAAGSRVLLSPPLFQGWAFDVPASRFRRSPATPVDFLSFLGRVSLPLLVHDDMEMALVVAKRRLGLVPEPAPGGAILRAAYGEIADIARRNGAHMVVVLLGLPPPDELKSFLSGLRGVAVADATEDVLCAHLPTPCRDKRSLTDEAYSRAYGHWAGEPPRLVDLHPNSRAHEVIAEEILKAITTTWPPEEVRGVR